MAADCPRWKMESNPSRITTLRRSITRSSRTYITELASRSRAAESAGSWARIPRTRSTVQRSSPTTLPRAMTVVGMLGRVLTRWRTRSEVIMVRSP